MKKITTILPLLILIFNQNSNAQFTQLEFASGRAKTDFTAISMQTIDPKKTFAISTLAFFQKFHEEENIIFDELGVQTTFFWNFSKSISIGPSLYYNSVSGFSERISLQFATKSKRISFVAIPSIAHMESTNFINGELILQMQYTQPIHEHWNVVVSAMLMSHWDKFSTHSRSFQQVRTGLSYKTTQFGLAADFDQYGKSPTKKTSIGFFVRKIVISK